MSFPKDDRFAKVAHGVHCPRCIHGKVMDVGIPIHPVNIPLFDNKNSNELIHCEVYECQECDILFLIQLKRQTKIIEK